MSQSQRNSGLAEERTALAWTRSALNIAATGLLISHGAFDANIPALGVIAALAASVFALLSWRHGHRIYLTRQVPELQPHHQSRPLGLLTTATVFTAAVATLLTFAG